MKPAKLRVGYGRFAVLVILITSLVYAAYYFLDHTSWPGRFTTALWVAPAFFCLLSLLVYFIALQAFRVSAAQFNTVIFSSMGIRVVLCLIYILIALGKTQDMLFFMAVFFIQYLLYTIFEIYCLVINLRPDFKKKGNPDE